MRLPQKSFRCDVTIFDLGPKQRVKSWEAYRRTNQFEEGKSYERSASETNVVGEA
jgi:hypothetical protein